MAQTIAISNQKGGVAKTTTCVSLGAALAEAGYPALLVDLDPQTSLSIALGFPEDNAGMTISDVLEGAVEQEGEEGVIVRHTSMPGLDVITADARLWTVERLISDRQGYETCLAEQLTRWQENYEFILLDCSPSLGPLTIMALTAARRVIIPVQTEFLAAYGLLRLIETIGAVQEHTNPDLKYDLLAVMYDQRNSICREVLERLQQNFTERIFQTVIGVDTRLRECVVNGVPVLQYDPRTRGSQQYRELAQEFLERMGCRKKKA